MTGSPGSPGPDGKAGPAVSSDSWIVSEQQLKTVPLIMIGESFLKLSRRPLIIFRVPKDKTDALDLPAPLDPEDSPEWWDSPDPRELVWVNSHIHSGFKHKNRSIPEGAYDIYMSVQMMWFFLTGWGWQAWRERCRWSLWRCCKYL